MDKLLTMESQDLSLEEAIEFIEDDELIEITPQSFRIRKTILDANKRYKANKNK